MAQPSRLILFPNKHPTSKRPRLHQVVNCYYVRYCKVHKPLSVEILCTGRFSGVTNLFTITVKTINTPRSTEVELVLQSIEHKASKTTSNNMFTFVDLRHRKSLGEIFRETKLYNGSGFTTAPHIY